MTHPTGESILDHTVGSPRGARRVISEGLLYPYLERRSIPSRKRTRIAQAQPGFVTMGQFPHTRHLDLISARGWRYTRTARTGAGRRHVLSSAQVGEVGAKSVLRNLFLFIALTDLTDLTDLKKEKERREKDTSHRDVSSASKRLDKSATSVTFCSSMGLRISKSVHESAR